MLICVTGIKGSGKSTAMKIISKQGFEIFIMDDWIHYIYKTNRIGYKLIKKHFGEEYVTENEVNRKKLGKLVFKNTKYLNKLNKIMIPIMQKKISELKTKNRLIFVELAIYLNHIKKFEVFFDKVVCILRKKCPQKNKNLILFSNQRNFPTNAVGNYKNNVFCNHFDSWIFVENYQNKNNLTKKIKNFLTFIKKEL